MTRQSTCASLRLILSAVLFALIFAVGTTRSIQAQTFSVFHAFSGTDGSVPNGDLTKDFQGNYYGTAQLGGTASHGVVFKLDSSGNETVLYNFTGGADGSNPYGRLLLTHDGTIFGMTLAGGDPNCQCGTVFRLATNGNFKVLHTFLGGTDGAQNFGQPGGGLLRIGQDLYGVTYFGGDITCDPGFGCGTIFKLKQSGQETILHTFSGGSDGAFPRELIADTADAVHRDARPHLAVGEGLGARFDHVHALAGIALGPRVRHVVGGRLQGHLVREKRGLGGPECAEERAHTV